MQMFESVSQSGNYSKGDEIILERANERGLYELHIHFLHNFV